MCEHNGDRNVGITSNSEVSREIAGSTKRPLRDTTIGILVCCIAAAGGSRRRSKALVAVAPPWTPEVGEIWLSSFYKLLMLFDVILSIVKIMYDQLDN